MSIKTYQYKDLETGVTFEITADFPLVGKDKVAKEYAAPVVDSINEVKRIVHSQSRIQVSIENFDFDIVTMLGARNQDFQFGACKIQSSGDATQIELEVTDPHGTKDILRTELGNIIYKGLIGKVDPNEIVRKTMLGQNVTLPIKQILNNGFFLPMEFEAASSNKQGLITIIEKSIAENPFWLEHPTWKRLSSSFSDVSVVDYVDNTLSTDRVTAVDIGNLGADKYRKPETPLHDIGLKVAILTGTEIKGYAVFTERAVELYKLPGNKKRYGVFSQQAFPGPRRGKELVAVIEEGKIKYNPIIETNSMKTNNQGYLVLPLLFNTTDKQEAMQYARLLKGFTDGKADTLVPISLASQYHQETKTTKLLVGIKIEDRVGSDILYPKAIGKLTEIIEYVSNTSKFKPCSINAQKN